MPIEIRSLVIGPNTPAVSRRADRAVQSLARSSRRQTQGLFDQHCVLLNGLVCQEPWRQLADGDRIEVHVDNERRYTPKKRTPKYLGFEILHNDPHLIVVNKPASWLSVPSPKRERNTLLQHVSDYLTKLNRGHKVFLYPVHRLDRGVSGVIVFAKDAAMVPALRGEFAQGKPERYYVAIVAGEMQAQVGEFRSHLTTDEHLNEHSTSDTTKGRLAITRYQVAQALNDATCVDIQLGTGRRNQIRVQFADAGHPVLGDPRYGKPASQDPRWTANRLALHAASLSFLHPATGQMCSFQAAMAQEIEAFIAANQRADDYGIQAKRSGAEK